MKRYSTVDARDCFSDVINHAAYGTEPVCLMRRGRDLVVVISFTEYLKYKEYKDSLEVKSYHAEFKPNSGCT